MIQINNHNFNKGFIFEAMFDLLTSADESNNEEYYLDVCELIKAIIPESQIEDFIASTMFM